MAGFCVRHVGDSRLCFVLGAPTKQNGGETKPFWRFAKATRNASWLTPRAIENDRPNRPLQGTVIIKALSAVAVAGFLAAGLTVLPGFAPNVEASTPQPLAKADRLDVRPIGRDCSQQAWPNFEASCMRVAGTKTEVREARLVTASRVP